ncbi:hypothetical protein BAC2_01382 [uncultured bacterium]|nr:hypothetical protein BAC2_01382 [uncultured bacterium]
MDDPTEKAIRKFVTHPIPPGGTREFDEWKQQVKAFGSESVQLFLELVATGSEEKQYVAVIALRHLGLEIWKDIENTPPVWQVRPRAGESLIEYPCRP